MRNIPRLAGHCVGAALGLIASAILGPLASLVGRVEAPFGDPEDECDCQARPAATPEQNTPEPACGDFDCCAGEEATTHPNGLHSFDCPTYVATVERPAQAAASATTEPDVHVRISVPQSATVVHGLIARIIDEHIESEERLDSEVIAADIVRELVAAQYLEV